MRRVAHPIDRRSALIEPTPTPTLEGEVGVVFAPLGSAVAALASAYSEHGLARIVTYLHGLIGVLKLETATPTAAPSTQRKTPDPARRNKPPSVEPRRGGTGRRQAAGQAARHGRSGQPRRDGPGGVHRLDHIRGQMPGQAGRGSLSEAQDSAQPASRQPAVERQDRAGRGQRAAPRRSSGAAGR